MLARAVKFFRGRTDGVSVYVAALLAAVASFGGVMVASLRIGSARGVQIAATFWLLSACVLSLLVSFDATPCGSLSGTGILQASAQCPVQPVHILDALLGGAGVLSMFTSSIGGFVYAQSGEVSARKVFRIALVVAMALVILLVAADLALPRDHPSD